MTSVFQGNESVEDFIQFCFLLKIAVSYEKSQYFPVYFPSHQGQKIPLNASSIDISREGLVRLVSGDTVLWLNRSTGQIDYQYSIDQFRGDLRDRKKDQFYGKFKVWAPLNSQVSLKVNGQECAFTPLESPYPEDLLAECRSQMLPYGEIDYVLEVSMPWAKRPYYDHKYVSLRAESLNVGNPYSSDFSNNKELSAVMKHNKVTTIQGKLIHRDPILDHPILIP